MLMIGDLFLGMLTGYLRSPLSFSLCSLGAPASAEGVRILYYGSIRYGCGFGVCVCVWVALAWRSAYGFGFGVCVCV